MGTEEKWYFTKEQLENSPSRQCGIDALKELNYRQQAASFIRDMGHKLNVSQLCANTAIVYMHRFYVFHSFTHFPWHSIAAAALFLAAKVEEQPRKVEYIVKVAYICKNHKDLNGETNSEMYQMLAQDLVFNENILLQTLGFDVAIDHPHTHIVRCCHLVRAGKDLAHTSYMMASNSLHLSTMCLQYKPTVVACFCIHLACKWSQWEIPLSNEKKEWFSYVDPTVTAELLQQLTEEFLVVFDQCQPRMKLITKSQTSQSNSPLEHDPKKGEPSDSKDSHSHRQSHHGEGKSGVFDDPHKHRSSRPHEHTNMQPHRDKEREYREKKERERLAQQQQQHGIKPSIHPNAPHKPSAPHHYHRDKQHSRMPMSSAPHARPEPRDILREATRDIGLRDYKRDPAKDPNGRDPNREHQQVRSDKDVQKREYLLKPNVTDPNNLNNHQDARLSYSGDKQRGENLRHVDPNKIPVKYDQTRRHDDVLVKNENEIKKHLSASSARDKNNAYVNKNVHSTSQKLKTPFAPETSKSVPKQNVSLPVKPEAAYNGNSSSYNGIPSLEEKIKQEIKTEFPMPPVKKPSLFSPEKSPPPKKPILPVKSSPIKTENHNTSSSSSDSSTSNKRASSEPELRPVMKKIDQVEGFENIMRNSNVGIKIPQVPDIITPIKDVKPDKPAVQYSKEMKPPDLIPPFTPAPLVNGIETNVALISNLLKETPTVPHLPAVAATTAAPVEEKVHHHKEHKKKNKEKHKHKDKDRSKEEKEKKKKHKDKDKEKHKHKEKDKEKRLEEQPHAPTQPIKITIHKDKIQPVESSPSLGTGLKIKIPKDRIKTDTIVEPSPSIKIKIPKEVISNYNSSESRKRDRDRTSPVDAPPIKISRSGSSKYGEPKQNGRHSHHKVAQLGDGDQSQHRLAESKYIKNSS